MPCQRGKSAETREFWQIFIICNKVWEGKSQRCWT